LKNDANYKNSDDNFKKVVEKGKELKKKVIKKPKKKAEEVKVKPKDNSDDEEKDKADDGK